MKKKPQTNKQPSKKDSQEFTPEDIARFRSMAGLRGYPTIPGYEPSKKREVNPDDTK